jgi:hypothetical protein
MLEDVPDVFLGSIVAVFRGFVKPRKGLRVILWLTPSFLGKVTELVFGHGTAMVGGAAIPGEGLNKVALDPESALVKVGYLTFAIR